MSALEECHVETPKDTFDNGWWIVCFFIIKRMIDELMLRVQWHCVSLDSRATKPIWHSLSNRRLSHRHRRQMHLKSVFAIEESKKMKISFVFSYFCMNQVANHTDVLFLKKFENSVCLKIKKSKKSKQFTKKTNEEWSTTIDFTQTSRQCRSNTTIVKNISNWNWTTFVCFYTQTKLHVQWYPIEDQLLEHSHCEKKKKMWKTKKKNIHNKLRTDVDERDVAVLETRHVSMHHVHPLFFFRLFDLKLLFIITQINKEEYVLAYRWMLTRGRFELLATTQASYLRYLRRHQLHRHSHCLDWFIV